MMRRYVEVEGVMVMTRQRSALEKLVDAINNFMRAIALDVSEMVVINH